MNSRITKISIGRLYNLGNYEHVRYDLTADIAEGESAHQIVCALERILVGLKPDRTLPTESEISCQMQRLSTMQGTPEEEWSGKFGSYMGAREQVIKDQIEQVADMIKRRENALSLAKKSRQMFDDLAGASKMTDAKLDWEDQDNGDCDF